MDNQPLLEGSIDPVLEAVNVVSESFKSLSTEKAVEHKEKLLYLNFENTQNNCWLDACIVLIANSNAFESDVKKFPSSEIGKIITTYKNALAILNDSNGLIQDRMQRTRTLLQGIQEKTLNYLKDSLRPKTGEPESAFCALLNLIIRDKSKIRDNMSVTWIWQKKCDNCGITEHTSELKKSIITFPKVNVFNPEAPICLYTCCSCKKEQEMKLMYKELPNCLIFHFEKGAGTGNNIPLSFTIDARKYHLTSVVLLEKSKDNPYINVNHFVTWMRQPSVDMWLDCNDLNTKIVQYGKKQPEWELNDLYMCVYEANDNLGKISHEILADSEQTRVVNAEVIDLSDEGENIDTSRPAQSEATTDNRNAEIPLNNYSNNGVEQPKNDMPKGLISSNDELSAFLTASSQEMSGIKETCDEEETNIIHQNMSLIDDHALSEMSAGVNCGTRIESENCASHQFMSFIDNQHTLSEMSAGVKCETGIESESCASETVYPDLPEIQTKTGGTHPKNGTSSALNQKSEFPYGIFTDKNDTSKKHAGGSKVGAVPRNKANELAGKSKEKKNQKAEGKQGSRNSNLGKNGPRVRPKLSDEDSRKLENIIDNVTTNVFSNFIKLICDEHEKKDS